MNLYDNYYNDKYHRYGKQAGGYANILAEDDDLDIDLSTVDKGKVLDALKDWTPDDIDEIPEEEIIDIEADEEEDLLDDYIGKVILQCNCCKAKVYKDPEDVEIDSDKGVANDSEQCPMCKNLLGYTVIGKIEPFEGAPAEEEEEADVEDDEEEDLVDDDMIEDEEAFPDDDIESDEDEEDVEDEEDEDEEDEEEEKPRRSKAHESLRRNRRPLHEDEDSYIQNERRLARKNHPELFEDDELYNHPELYDDEDDEEERSSSIFADDHGSVVDELDAWARKHPDWARKRPELHEDAEGEEEESSGPNAWSKF